MQFVESWNCDTFFLVQSYDLVNILLIIPLGDQFSAIFVKNTEALN